MTRGQTWADLQALWHGLDDRRAVLNTQLPCRPCGNQPPLQADPRAAHSGHPYQPEWEDDLLDLQRVGTYLAGAYWVRQGSPNGAIGLGGTKYWVGPAIANQGVKITFDPAGWCFMLHTAGRTADIPLAPQGLTKTALMGVWTAPQLPGGLAARCSVLARQSARRPGPPGVVGCKAFSGICEPWHTEGLTVGSRVS